MPDRYSFVGVILSVLIVKKPKENGLTPTRSARQPVGPLLKVCRILVANIAD